jgi:hypothetical protein
MATFGQMIAKSFLPWGKDDLKLTSPHQPVVGTLSDEFGLSTDVANWPFSDQRDVSGLGAQDQRLPSEQPVHQPAVKSGSRFGAH